MPTGAPARPTPIATPNPIAPRPHIRTTARQQWRLLAVNLFSSVLEALSEGATLAVVFLALSVLPVGAALSDWNEPGLASP